MGRERGSDYGYSDADISALLNHYFSPEMQKEKNIKAFLAGLDQDNGSQFSQTLRELLNKALDKAFIVLVINSPSGARNGDQIVSHATMLVIDFNEKKITYKDPYGIQMDKKSGQFRTEELQLMPKLHDILQKNLSSFDIVDLLGKQYDDAFSCAPVTIRNLVRVLHGKELEPTVDVANIRSEHCPILEAADIARQEMARQKVVFSVSAVCAILGEKNERISRLLLQIYDETNDGRLGLLINEGGALTATGEKLREAISSLAANASESDDSLLASLRDAVQESLKVKFGRK